MINTLLFWAVFVVVIWVLSPRMFIWTDRRVACRYIAPLHLTTSQSTSLQHSSPTPRKKPSTRSQNSFFDFAQAFDALARATRSHIAARDALSEVLQSLVSTPPLIELRSQLQQGEDILTALRDCKTIDKENRFLQLLQHSLVHGTFIPQALEQSAAILREDAQHQQNMQTAVAQARSTVRLLSLLPFIVLGLMFFASHTTRKAIITAPTLFVIGVGFALNRTGWSWVQHMVKRSSLSAPTLASQLSDAVNVALRAGVPLPQAIENWAREHDVILSEQLSHGVSFAEALQNFASRQGADAFVLARVLTDAHRDGLPIVDTIHRLSSETRSHRRHESEKRLRQLPNKLALPVVFCVLPSFILLTIFPLGLANLHHFTFSPPSINASS